MRTCHLFIALCLVVCCYTGSAQTSQGTEFWLGYMENLDLLFNDAPRFAIQVDADVTTSGIISVPTTGLTIPFTANPGDVTEVFLPDAIWYAFGSEDVDQKGILITTDSPVRISAMHYRAYFSEGTQLLPLPELGTAYRVTCYKDDNGNDPSSFVIVATQDGTTVEITPTVLTFGLRPPGVPFTVELQEGETYQVQAVDDLSGTSINSLSGQPIAVFSGARQVEIGNCGLADSHVYDQAIPVDAWGTLYHFVPFLNQGGDVVKILASEDDTDVFIDCVASANLQAGEQYVVELSNAATITATAPVAVSQFKKSYGCSPVEEGDPSMMRLLPASHQGNEVRFLSSGLFNNLIGTPYFSQHYVNIVIPTEFTNIVGLDGDIILQDLFQPFPANAAFSYAQIPVSDGVHFLNSFGPFQAYSYGFGQFDAYTTRLGYSLVEEPPFACLDIEVDGPFCVDSLLQFSYTTSISVVSQSWNFDNIGTSDLANPSFTFTEPGPAQIILSVVDEQGDIYTDTLNIDIQECGAGTCEMPLLLNILAEPEACANDAIPLAFDFEGTAVSAFWSFDNGLTAQGFNPSVQIGQLGTYDYVLSVTDELNCTYTAVGSITIVDCGGCPPEEVDVAFDGVLCVDSLVTFLSPVTNPVSIIEWTINGELFLEENPTVVFTEAEVISVSVFAIDLLGCLYVGAVEFSVADCGDNPCVNLPPVEISIEGAFCVDSILTASLVTEADITNFSWTATNGAFGNGPTFSNTFLEIGVETIFFGGTDADGCTYGAALDLGIVNCGPAGCEDLPSVFLELAGNPCADTLLLASFETTAEFLSVTWSASSGDSGQGTTFPVTFEQAGPASVSFAAIDFQGCSYAESLFLEIQDCSEEEECPGAVEILLDTSGYCLDSLIDLNAETEEAIVDYTWFFNSGAFLEGNNLSVPFVPGEYTLSVVAITEDGCSYSDAVDFQVDSCLSAEPCHYDFPNVFTPNLDGVNDEFGLLYNCAPNGFELKIFNRWGQMVYDGEEYEQGWDGTFNGRPAPVDVYMWIARVVGPDGEEETRQGNVTLLR